MSITEAGAAGVRCVRATDGDAFWVVGDTYAIKTSAQLTGGAYGLVEASVPPGSGPPPHVHTREDEAFYVLDGQLEFTAGSRPFWPAPATTSTSREATCTASPTRASSPRAR
jgi:hypothetical protein